MGQRKRRKSYLIVRHVSTVLTGLMYYRPQQYILDRHVSDSAGIKPLLHHSLDKEYPFSELGIETWSLVPWGYDHEAGTENLTHTYRRRQPIASTFEYPRGGPANGALQATPTISLLVRAKVSPTSADSRLLMGSSRFTDRSTK